MNNIDYRVKKVMSAVFDVPIGKITGQSSQDSIESWDSLKSMTLVVALEEEFDLFFSENDIARIIDLDSIITIVRRELNNGK
jgi:acyl carrier protein